MCVCVCVCVCDLDFWKLEFWAPESEFRYLSTLPLGLSWQKAIRIIIQEPDPDPLGIKETWLVETRILGTGI